MRTAWPRRDQHSRQSAETAADNEYGFSATIVLHNHEAAGS
jgi:hypothetical protein